MGATTFFNTGFGNSAKEVFDVLVSNARYDYGHGGYTGTIAEKSSFTMISLPKGTNPMYFAESLIDARDIRVDDKWGPAGCIECPSVDKNNKTYLFFGWASE